MFSTPFVWLLLFLVSTKSSIVFGQGLNVIPELFRPYLNEYPELQTLNILGNISDVLFSTAKQESNVDLGFYKYRKSYDFIIVGSGPAGCVLANRLSANPKWTVLLLEAGSPESIVQQIPLATSLTASSKYVRNYFFERKPEACLNIVDKECPFQTGVALGGASVVNNFIYTRGSRHDYNKWQDMGNEGWGYKEILPYFERIEKRTTGSVDYRAAGVLNIENPRYATGLLPMYLKSFKGLGEPVVDLSDEIEVGVGVVQGTSSKGRRISAAAAYINPIYKERPNLHILTTTRATKILIDTQTKVAYAVQYRSDGIRSIVSADKEIILSAGAIGSAHLLMVSGVGPKQALEKANVTVIENLSVGQNFKTNIAVHAPHFLLNTSSQSLHIKRIGLNSFLQFNSGRGPLTSYSGTEALAYLKSPYQIAETGQPDVEISFVSGGMQSDLGIGFRKASQIKESVYDALFKPIEGTQVDSWSTIVMNLHTKSRGKIKLIDSDINTDPILDYSFFQDPVDLKVLLFGLGQVVKLSQTHPMQILGTRLHEINLPSCAHLSLKTDEYWECYIRHVTTVAPQMIATNKMGLRSDPEAVVDSKLRVHGVHNLRVADTSIIPTTISGHLQAVSYVIGEKLAHMLINTWNTVSNRSNESKN